MKLDKEGLVFIGISLAPALVYWGIVGFNNANHFYILGLLLCGIAAAIMLNMILYPFFRKDIINDKTPNKERMEP